MRKDPFRECQHFTSVSRNFALQEEYLLVRIIYVTGVYVDIFAGAHNALLNGFRVVAVQEVCTEEPVDESVIVRQAGMFFSDLLYFRMDFAEVILYPFLLYAVWPSFNLPSPGLGT